MNKKRKEKKKFDRVSSRDTDDSDFFFIFPFLSSFLHRLRLIPTFVHQVLSNIINFYRVQWIQYFYFPLYHMYVLADIHPQRALLDFAQSGYRQVIDGSWDWLYSPECKK